MAVKLRKAFIDPWASKPVHESVLHVRRMVDGRRLSWSERSELRSNDLDGLARVFRFPRRLPQYDWDYDGLYGSWGVWDRWEGVFVAHAGSETGVRVMTRRMNQEGNR